MRDWLGLILVACALALAPAVLPPFAMTLLTEALILGLFAMSLDLMVGYTRLLSFGHAAAYGLGAYTAGNLLLHTDMPMVFAVPRRRCSAASSRSAWPGSARSPPACRSPC